MRYWLSIGDGKSYGPYTIDELRPLAETGRLDAASMLCVEGGAQWRLAGDVLLSEKVLGFPPLTDRVALGAQLRINLMWSILSTLCCCLPLGIGAIMSASGVNALLNAGDLEGATRERASYRMWMIATVALGLVCNVAPLFWIPSGLIPTL